MTVYTVFVQICVSQLLGFPSSPIVHVPPLFPGFASVARKALQKTVDDTCEARSVELEFQKLFIFCSAAQHCVEM